MNKLTDLSQQLAKLLLQQQKQLAVAESCTGGWVAKCLTDIAGSSQWFDRGFVTYSNAAKQEMLGVQPATLEHDGAVSEATVLEMAAGVLNNSAADIAVANVSGFNCLSSDGCVNRSSLCACQRCCSVGVRLSRKFRAR